MRFGKRFLPGVTAAALALTAALAFPAAGAKAEAKYPYELEVVKALPFLGDDIYRCDMRGDGYLVAETNWTTTKFQAWFYDFDGKEVFPSTKDYQLAVMGDVAFATLGSIIDKNGKALVDVMKGDVTLLIDGSRNWPSNVWHNGYTVLAKRDRSAYAVMDRDGKIVVPYGKYNVIDFYDGDTAIVKVGTEWQIVDAKTGNLIKSLKGYNFTFDNKQHREANQWLLAAYHTGGVLFAWDDENKKNVAINKYGEVIFESEQWIQAVDGDFAIINDSSDDGWKKPALIDKNGNVIMPHKECVEMTFYGDGIVAVTWQDGFPPELYNTKGEVVAKLGEYAGMRTRFKNGFAVALLNASFNTKLAAEHGVGTRTAKADDDYYYVIIGTDGKIAADVFSEGYQNTFSINDKGEFPLRINGAWYLVRLVKTGTSKNPPPKIEPMPMPTVEPIVTPAPTPTRDPNAPKVGTKLGDVLYTDIKAYINGQAIPSYNISGSMYVLAADLRNYGFDVTYDDKTRSTTIKLAAGKAFTPLPVAANSGKVGSPAFAYLYTDIRTYINGKEATSRNVNNQTAIPFAELRAFGTVKYDDATRSSTLTIK